MDRVKNRLIDSVINSSVYLTPEETATFLLVSQRTLADYRSKGRLPRYIKRGKTVRYPAEAIIEFIVERNKAKYMPIYDELLRSTLEHGS